MNGLFRASLEEQKPILIMYMTDEREITDRNIIVKKIHPEYIRAFCMKSQALRAFKRENILAAFKPRQKRGVRYA